MSRCQRAKLVCEYSVPKTWLFELSSKGPVDSDFEQHLLNFSCRDGVQFVTLYAKSSIDFFEVIAPQMTHTHPSAKHALTGMAAQYKAIMQNVQPNASKELTKRYRTDALLRYNLAMREITSAYGTDQELPLELVLTCGLLFTSMELCKFHSHQVRVGQDWECTSHVATPISFSGSPRVSRHFYLKQG
jgi:hypothetical protein